MYFNILKHFKYYTKTPPNSHKDTQILHKQPPNSHKDTQILHNRDIIITQN